MKYNHYIKGYEKTNSERKRCARLSCAYFKEVQGDEGTNMNSIFKRRSIRKFTGQPISDEDLQLMLKAAMYAPSAGNEQPWEFIVVRDKQNLQALCNVHPHAKMLPSADLAVAICGNLPKQKYSVQYWVQDCTAAGENLMLQATELGIGTVWLGVYPCEYRTENIARILGVPQEVIPLCIIAAGYPAEEKEQPQRFDSQKIHFEKW